MRFKYLVPALAFVLVVLFDRPSLGGDLFLEVIGNNVNIRTAPDSSSAVVGKALQGDVFRLYNEGDEWHEIFLFSGEARYIQKSLSKIVSYEVATSTSENFRRKLFKEFLEAEDRSVKEADKKYPISDRYGRPIRGNLERNIKHQRLLDDRYKLQVVHQYGVQPSVYNKIAVEGVKKGWNLK